jgi:hypothetical protein
MGPQNMPVSASWLSMAEITIFLDGDTKHNQLKVVEIYFYITLALGFSSGIYLLTRGLAMYVGDAVADRVAAILVQERSSASPKT